MYMYMYIYIYTIYIYIHKNKKAIVYGYRSVSSNLLLALK